MKNNLLILEFTESEFEEFKKILEEKRKDYPKSIDRYIYEAIGDYLDSTFIPPSIGIWTKEELEKELDGAKKE